MDYSLFIVPLLWLTTLVVSVSGENYCVVNGNLKYCRYGCCGGGGECCGMTPAVIVGIVIGVLFIVGGIVCCILCCFCLAKNRHGHSTGVQPVPYNNNSVYVSTAPHGPHPPPHGPHPPPAYTNYNSYPSAAGISNPSDAAYPPGSVSQPPAYTYSSTPAGK